MQFFFKTPLRRLATLVLTVMCSALLTAFMVHVPRPSQEAAARMSIIDSTQFPAPDAPPVSIAPPTDDRPDFDLRPWEIQGTRIARLQLQRGAPKKLDRRVRRDQSFAGLRDILRDSSDPEILAYAPFIDQLQQIVDNRDRNREPEYTETFVKEMYPLAHFIEERSGIPAVVILSQIMLESGWGTSNITILKNNLMGIGNATREEDFVARLELPGFTRDIPVHCMKDTTAYSFENIADSVFYYVYVLLQSPDNALHYGELREYIRENRVLRQNAPKTYRKRVIELIADSYHSDPDWYAGYLTRFARRFDKVLSP